ncbi:MAG: DUF6596 domain-containing protein [Pseudomonadota bacterium]
MGSTEGRRAAEQAARLAYGRLIATLCQQGVGIAQAEDALSNAFVKALDRWDTHGVPEAPDAWLLTTARRALIDQSRHVAVKQRVEPELIDLFDRLEADSEPHDRRLDLMMLCAHPAIAANVRAPLMLQTVLGLTAQDMSAAFLVSPAALGQRLARAKKQIGQKQPGFVIPDEAEQARRVHDVLDAIYAAFGTGYDAIEDARDWRHGLAHEAIWLAQILVHTQPDIAEAQGLLSLMLFVQARVEARRNAQGAYVPLSEQDRAHWDWRIVAAAEHHLGLAAALKAPGRFQLEAAIQSHHMQFNDADGPDWSTIARLYDALVVQAPSLAAWVGRAAAMGEVEGAPAGLAALDLIPADRVRSYQPYWAVRAHLCTRAQRAEDARQAYERAIGLCDDPAVRDFLIEQLSRA